MTSHNYEDEDDLIRSRARELGQHYERSAKNDYVAPSSARPKFPWNRIAAAALVVLCIGLLGAVLATRSDNEATTAAAPSSDTSTPRFGTMPEFAPNERIELSQVPDYISVVDPNAMSDEVIGYVKSSTLVGTNKPIARPEGDAGAPNPEGGPPAPPSGTPILRMYDTNLRVIGYFVPRLGPVLGENADRVLEDPAYFVDPSS